MAHCKKCSTRECKKNREAYSGRALRLEVYASRSHLREIQHGIWQHCSGIIIPCVQACWASQIWNIVVCAWAKCTDSWLLLITSMGNTESILQQNTTPKGNNLRKQWWSQVLHLSLCSGAFINDTSHTSQFFIPAKCIRLCLNAHWTCFSTPSQVWLQAWSFSLLFNEGYICCYWFFSNPFYLLHHLPFKEKMKALSRTGRTCSAVCLIFYAKKNDSRLQHQIVVE